MKAGGKMELARIRHSAAVSRANARHGLEIDKLKSRLTAIRNGAKEVQASSHWQFAGGALTGALVGTVAPIVAFKKKRSTQRIIRALLGLIIGGAGLYYKQPFAAGTGAGILAAELGISGVEATAHFLGRTGFEISAGAVGRPHMPPLPVAVGERADVIPVV